MSDKKGFPDKFEEEDEDISLEESEEGYFEESLDDLEKEELNTGKLDTFSEAQKHDGTYKVDEDYFEEEE